MTTGGLAEESSWLLSWFEKKGPVPGTTLQEKLSVLYFDAGLIDSMGAMELVADVEKHFQLRFTERHFQDRRFLSIQGLAGLIREIRNYESREMRKQ